MKIRHVSVQNFRGIRELNWSIMQSLNCLVGQGDSTKSTILDAINLALSPRWSLQFTDADFYNGMVDNRIEIITTVGELPDYLISQDKFGLHLRGWSLQDGIIDEPEDGTESVLSVALRVDEILEPTWSVVNDRDPEGKLISASDRNRLRANWIGTYVDRQLSWGKFSALSRLAGDDEEVSSVLAEASRQARQAVATASLDELNKSAVRAGEAAKAFGVHPTSQFNVGLDAKLSITGQATLTLHDGQVPARMAGLGSRRLLALAIQHQGVPEGGIMLIDEIEAGLEPHRLRHLIRMLRPEHEGAQQVFMTTHSNVAIEELRANELNIVQNHDGKIEIKTTEDSLQGLVRTAPEAFLGRKIIVCEGSTEVGFIRALDMYWQSEAGGGLSPLAFQGVVPVTSRKGGGDEMPKAALSFRKLEFNTAFFGDSDKPLNPPETELDKAGVVVFRWDGKTSIEERICLDLPFSGLNDFIQAAVECFEEIGGSAEGVFDSIGSEFELKSGLFAGKVEALKDHVQDEKVIRQAIGRKAKEKGWYKRISGGEHLGFLVAQHLGEMGKTDVKKKIVSLREWADE